MHETGELKPSRRSHEEWEGCVELNEGLAQWLWKITAGGEASGPVRLEQAEVNATDNERQLYTGRRDAKAEGMRLPLDEAVQAKTTEIVGHRTRRVAGDTIQSPN